MAGILVYIAFLCDLVELALDSAGTAAGVVMVVVGYLKDGFSLIFFPTAFFLLGAPPWKGRKAKQKLITLGTGFLISLVPWVGAILPETTISVLVTILFVYAEDRGISASQISNTIVRFKRQ